MQKTGLADRMKAYEANSNITLTKRIPVIIRVDGKNFSKIVKQYFGKEWSNEFSEIMQNTALAVQKEIQGCKFCYSQSDEISFLLTDYETVTTSSWLGYRIQKLVSIIASLTTYHFIKQIIDKDIKLKTPITFDARAFTLPKEEVTNYFIWRQKDAIRNAIQFKGREHYSAKALQGVPCDTIITKLYEDFKIDFNNLSLIRRRGFCVIDSNINNNIPLFTDYRNFIEKWCDHEPD